MYSAAYLQVLLKEKGSRVNPKDGGVHIRGKSLNARAKGLRWGRAREGGVPLLVGGGLGGHSQENFENWMMKYAISGYQGTTFAAVFKSLIVYLFGKLYVKYNYINH